MMAPHQTKTPIVLQMEMAECGAAALGIILGFHGRHEPLARLRGLCGVSRNGSNATAMLAAARSFGLDAHAYRSEISDLRSLRGPFIVFWKFNHFVVVERICQRTVYLNDPASGRRSVAIKDFDKAFTGIVLTFSRGPDFSSGGRTPRAWDLLRGRVQGLEPGLTFVALTTLTLIVPSMVAAALPKIFFDGILIDGSTPWLRPLLLFMAAAAVALLAVHWLQQQALLTLCSRW